MTGCDRVLERLKQGPATAHELYQLGVIAHSRISDLRRKGYVIECDRDADRGSGAAGYVYTLKGDAGSAEASSPTAEFPPVLAVAPDASPLSVLTLSPEIASSSGTNSVGAANPLSVAPTQLSLDAA